MTYVFDPDILHKIAQGSMGLPDEQLFETLRVELDLQYPGQISPTLEWSLNNAGGCMYGIGVLHASFTEYLLIFGSAIGTAGHTGRHRAEIFDFVLEGELWYFSEDKPYQRIVRRAGDRYLLPKGKSEGLRIQDHCWVLEYARGFIPSMLPFGLADSFLSTLDFKTIGRTLAIYNKLFWQQRNRRLKPMPQPFTSAHSSSTTEQEVS
jgi:C-8 sterol isomerase